MTNTLPQADILSPMLQQCGVLREKVRKVKSHEGSEQTLRTWRPIREALPSHLERMQKLVAVLRILHSHRMLTAGRSPSPRKLGPLFESLETLRDRFLNKPGKVMEGNTWAKCNTSLSSFATTLEDNLKAIWSDLIGQLIPNLDDLGPFLNLERCAAEVRKITELQEHLRRLQQSLPDGEEAFREAEKKSREIQQRVAKLDLGDVPIAVKRFIQRVNSLGGANLGDLTDEVLSWLGEKNLLQSFRVSNARR